MKYTNIFLFSFCSLFFLSEVAGFVHDKNNHLSDLSKRDLFRAEKDFKCPFIFGNFADPDDCSAYYVCVAGVHVHKKCSRFMSFDVLRMRCLPSLVAITGCNKDKTKSSTVTTTETTSSGGNFKCPSMMGSYPDPNDCSKYYTCTFYRHTAKTCSKNQLFDADKKTCKAEKNVDCGTRPRPKGYTTTPIPTETTTPTTNTPTETTTEAITLTETETTPEITTEAPESSIQDIITTTSRPTGPPDHDCYEDDVDCIITETGDVEDWFTCPRDIGSFVHPSSDKLFIFCMNWIPSVKKCGMNLVFSKEISTCVESKYFL